MKAGVGAWPSMNAVIHKNSELLHSEAARRFSGVFIYLSMSENNIFDALMLSWHAGLSVNLLLCQNETHGLLAWGVFILGGGTENRQEFLQLHFMKTKTGQTKYQHQTEAHNSIILTIIFSGIFVVIVVFLWTQHCPMCSFNHKYFKFIISQTCTQETGYLLYPSCCLTDVYDVAGSKKPFCDMLQ